MMSGSIPGNKGGDTQHKLWRHVLPRLTEFAWLPRDLAEAFCLPALQLDPNRPYGVLANCVAPQTLKATITVDQLYFIGDSRSANELEVFINMPIERLRVGCGLQCTLPHLPLGPSSRPLLFSAAVKLLKFALIVALMKQLTLLRLPCGTHCTHSCVIQMNMSWPHWLPWCLHWLKAALTFH